MLYIAALLAVLMPQTEGSFRSIEVYPPAASTSSIATRSLTPASWVTTSWR